MKNTHQGPYVRYISGTEQLNQLFQENQFIMVNFYATWCPPALFQQPFLIPAAEKHKTFILAIVDCSDAHNKELKKKFEISALPAIYLLQKNIGTIISYFVGAEQNKLYEMINKIDTLRKIDPEPKIQKQNENDQGPYVRQISLKTQKDKKFKCQKRRHELFLTTKLNPPYHDGRFICKICQSNEKVSKQSPILHCYQCNYDICYNCRRNPPAPKNFNQNDKVFICQKGGHELFLTTKLDPSYFDGQFICNICRNSDIVSQQYPILHCNLCNYDVCFDCRQNPPLPKTQNDKKFKCQKGDELYLVNKLNPPYHDGRFICNLCRSHEKVSQQRPILHCNQCNYDVCFDCRQMSPPVPKNFNQNDQMFVCQKGHELFLTIKLNPSYQNGQFTCNICRNDNMVSYQRPILHCDQCNYDVCFDCRQNPPESTNQKLNENHYGSYVRQISGVQQLTQLFNQNQFVIVDFWAPWCPPCVKFKPQLIKAAQQHKIFILACVNCDDPSNLPLKKKFSTSSIPAIFLLHKNIDTISSQFVGANQGEFNKMIGIIKAKRNEKIKNSPTFYCQLGHKLVLTTVLPDPPYSHGIYNCDLCKQSGKASQQAPILHCATCSYDVCYMCSQE